MPQMMKIVYPEFEHFMKPDAWRIINAIFMLVAGTVLSYLGFLFFYNSTFLHFYINFFR